MSKIRIHEKKLSHIKLMISEKVEELEPKFLLHLVSEIFLTHLDGEIIVECEKTYFEFPPALGALCAGGYHSGFTRHLPQVAFFFCHKVAKL